MTKEEIILKIERTETLLMQAQYGEAYEILCEICGPYPNFKEMAGKIMRRYNDCCIEIVSGKASLSEQSLMKNDIADSCQLCLKQLGSYLENTQTDFIENEKTVLKNNQKHYLRTRLKLEEEYLECDDPEKRGILKKILAEIRKMLQRFDNLLKHFAKIKNYERI